jgi:hypothetical protein
MEELGQGVVKKGREEGRQEGEEENGREKGRQIGREKASQHRHNNITSMQQQQQQQLVWGSDIPVLSRKQEVCVCKRTAKWQGVTGQSMKVRNNR